MSYFVSCLFMAIVLLCIRDCCMYLQSYAEIFVLYCWMVGSSTLFFITPILEWTYNVFWPSYHPFDLTHYGASVTADFTIHGRSHIYGLPYPSADSLDPMDHFCTFDVSNIIPKTCIICYTRLLNLFSRIYVV